MKKLGPQVLRLIERLSIPVVGVNSIQKAQIIYRENLGLVFCDPRDKIQLYFDIIQYWRVLRGQGKKKIFSSPLYRALNLKKFDDPQVWDCGCATGKDTVLMQSMGVKKMIAYDRDPLVALLLSDALDRLDQSGYKGNAFRFIYGDIKFSEEPLPDILYFDPMYDHRVSKALPCKEMQVFRKRIPSSREESLSSLQWAMDRKIKRIIVKRRMKDPPLDRNVTASFKGRKTRYDLYCS